MNGYICKILNFSYALLMKKQYLFLAVIAKQGWLNNGVKLYVNFYLASYAQYQSARFVGFCQKQDRDYFLLERLGKTGNK
jgi:hypothetical protein